MKFHQVCRYLCLPCLPLKKLWCWLFLHRARRKFILVTLAVYIVTFIVILPLLMEDVPLTKYYRWFHKSHISREARNLNRRYADLASKKLESLPKGTKRLYEESSRRSDLEFVVAVITMRRGGYGVQTQYLTQVMLGLHEALHDKTDRATLFMCNTNQGKHLHKEAIGLSDYFPMIDIKTAHTDNGYESEKLHYAACLAEAQKFTSKYVLMLQDDALPHKDFLSTLKYILEQKIDSQNLHGNYHHQDDDWLWLKLNFSNSLSKFHGNYFFALEWVSLSVLFASIFVIVFWFIHSTCCGFKSSRDSIENTTNANGQYPVRTVGGNGNISNGVKHPIGNGINNKAQTGSNETIHIGFASNNSNNINGQFGDGTMDGILSNGTRMHAPSGRNHTLNNVTGLNALNGGIHTINNGHGTQSTTLKPIYRNRLNYYAIFLAATAYFMLLLDVTGRGFVNLPRYYSESFYALGPGTSCCLPAVVYPRTQIPSILNYLDSIVLDEDNPLDFAMDDYRRVSGLRQYLVNPNIFSHIGFYSALHSIISIGAAEDYLFSMKLLKDQLPSFYQDSD